MGTSRSDLLPFANVFERIIFVAFGLASRNAREAPIPAHDLVYAEQVIVRKSTYVSTSGASQLLAGGILRR